MSCLAIVVSVGTTRGHSQQYIERAADIESTVDTFAGIIKFGYA
jgi:hypothetical protein